MATVQSLRDNIFQEESPRILGLLQVRNAHEKSKASDNPHAVIAVTNSTSKITAARVVVRGLIFSSRRQRES